MPTSASLMLLSADARRVAGQSALAIFALLAVALACTRLQPGEPSLTVAALVYLVIVVFLSLNGSFVATGVVSVIAVVFLQDLASLPLFSLSLDERLDVVALGAFLTTALVITRLVTRMRTSLENLQKSHEDLRRAEEATRQQAALLDLTHDTVFVRDTDDRVTFWNRGARELYGWSAEEVMGRRTHDLLRTEFPASLEDITAELTRSGRWEGELTHTRRDDAQVTVASRWSLQRDAQGLPVATLETNNDITARKQAESALSQAQLELARVARITTLGELTASIAHEVNQPLTAIVADSNAALNWLARETPDLEIVRETLLAIVKDSERAASVFTRIRGMLSRSVQPFHPCDLGAIVADTLPLIRAEFARHAIHVEVSFAVERPLVSGDAIQLQQVLLNLLLNAAEASREVVAERRSVTVSTEVQRGALHTHVVVKVRDAGVGLGDADLTQLFQPFYTTKAGGLGMGLSVSRAIVERHGGRLWVTANTDYGATFQLSIPAQS
jgi:two-component system sensor kinase FixL